MQPMNETAQSVVTIAERMIREGGYHAFSFRKIADELGVKSASIHYHFANKEALGAAVTRHYTENFLAHLGDPSSHEKPVEHYGKAFQAALNDAGRSCLCGVLAAESGGLPSAVRVELSVFTERNVQWLTQALHVQCASWSQKKCEEVAVFIFSALEGAIIFAVLQQDASQLDRVVDSLEALLQ